METGFEPFERRCLPGGGSPELADPDKFLRTLFTLLREILSTLLELFFFDTYIGDALLKLFFSSHYVGRGCALLPTGCSRPPR